MFCGAECFFRKPEQSQTLNVKLSSKRVNTEQFDQEKQKQLNLP